MKALSFTQPWATLVAIGAKKIETRSWPTSYRGPLAIHAAKAMPGWAFDLTLEQPFKSCLVGATLPRGVVLATVMLVDCIPTHEAMKRPDMTSQEYVFGNYEPGRFAWIMTKPIALEKPVPARGFQRLWEWDQTA